MKNHLAIAATGMVAMLSTALVGCSGAADKTAGANDKAAASDSTKGGVTLNIRYIDADSVSANYNLAKDFKEAALRTYSKIESAQNSRAAEIQRLGQKIEQNMRSNYYVGKESEYEADVRRLNKMQQDAEAYMANLQRTSQQEMAQQQVELNDSLESFLKEYNKTKGYDAILFKAAGAYFNPALDITKEVTAGLNARYNKVEKKK
ncbi:MAG: OmpH family outer membrane protein [Candidatus Amulumruptor sp.]